MLAAPYSKIMPVIFYHEVIGDSMEPTYLRNRDSVICTPVTGYVCEGVYLISGELYRCQREGRYVRMWRDNPHYPEYRAHIDLFNESQLALVIADVSIRNPTVFRIVSESARFAS